MSMPDEMIITIKDDDLSHAVIADITRTLKQDMSRRLSVETVNLTAQEIEVEGTKGFKEFWDQFKVIISSNSELLKDKALEIFDVVLDRFKRTASLTVKMKMPSGAEFEFNAENMTPEEIEKTKQDFLAFWKAQA